MSGVGNSTFEVHEKGNEQKLKPQDNVPERYHEGQKHSHKALDSKDQRSIANRLDHAEKHDDDAQKSMEQRRLEKDATLPAIAHGNKPSKGAIIDQQLREEEEEELKRKGKA